MKKLDNEKDSYEIDVLKAALLEENRLILN
jgi:hypothetical protein